jgi:hypothetical protein
MVEQKVDWISALTSGSIAERSLRPPSAYSSSSAAWVWRPKDQKVHMKRVECRGDATACSGQSKATNQGPMWFSSPQNHCFFLKRARKTVRIDGRSDRLTLNI